MCLIVSPRLPLDITPWFPPLICYGLAIETFVVTFFVDEGVLVETASSDRQDQSSGVREDGCYLAIGADSLNLGKLGIDGMRPSRQNISGYEVDFEKSTITLTDGRSSGRNC